MLNLVGGVIAFGVTLLLLKLCLPPHGRVRRFVGTEWEPYVAVGLTVALADIDRQAKPAGSAKNDP